MQSLKRITVTLFLGAMIVGTLAPPVRAAEPSAAERVLAVKAHMEPSVRSMAELRSHGR